MQVEYYDGGQWVGLCAPSAAVPITTGLDWRNGNQRGFRLGHLTQPTDNLGMLHLSMLSYQQANENSGLVSTRIMTFNDNNSEVFEFLKPVKLTQGFSSNFTLDLNGNRIINLADPLNIGDAVNLGYMNQAIANAFSSATTITLTGAVSGSGSGTISTTLTTRLNQVLVPTGTVDLNNQRISNLASPTLSNDATNKTYVDNRRLDQLLAPTSAINVNLQRITNVASPSSSSDAATKAYVDAQASSGTPYINQLPINGDVNLGSYALGAFNLTAGNQMTASQFVINNSSLLNAIGLKINAVSSRTIEFGYNSNLNEAYVWTSLTTPIKFGTNGIKRMDISATTGKTTIYDGSYQLYFRPASNYLDLRESYVYNSATSSIIETNALGETAAIVMNGDYMQFITPMDTLGFIFSDEDNNPQTTYVSYISSSGSLVISSSKERKYSIYKKTQKDYLSRLNQLGIYSYALKVPVLEEDSVERKTRKYFKNKELQLGVLAEEVETLFDNATNITKLITIDKRYNNSKDFNQLTQNFQPAITDEEYIAKKQENKGIGVDYQRLLCYTILAMQELSQQVALLEKQIQVQKPN